jgi:hypothetical protein
MQERGGGARPPKALRSVFFFLFILIVSGCKDHVPAGHYEGNLSVQDHSKLSTLPVGIDIVYHDFRSGSALLKNLQGKVLTTIDVRRTGMKELVLSLPSVRAQPFYLKKEKGCYSHHSNLRVELCSDGKNFVLNVHQLSGNPVLLLSGTTFPEGGPRINETPRKVTLDEAVELALTKSFASRVEYLKLKQAKFTAISGFLSLMPRLNLGSLVWNASMDLAALPVSMIAAIGDLAPFMLPNRWMQAYEKKELYSAEKIAMILMQADLASQVEGLAYILDKDKKVSDLYQKLINFISTLMSRVENETTKKQLDLFLQSLLLDMSNMEDAVRVSRYALALSLGFQNPETVEALELNSERLTIDSAQNEDPLKGEELTEIYRRRSFELKQLKHLKKVRHLERVEHWFTSLDPQGDSQYGIGPALFVLSHIDKLKIKELDAQQVYVDAQIAQKAHEVAASYNKSIRSYKIASRIHQNALDNLKLYFQDLPLEKLDVDALETKIQKIISSTATLEGIRANFRIARSKVDRIYLQGYYQRLLPHLSSDEGEASSLVNASLN